MASTLLSGAPRPDHRPSAPAALRVCLGLGLAAALAAGGCTAIDRGPDTAALQEAMGANHQATIAVLTGMNRQELPYRIEDGLARSSFSKDDLGTLAPADIAAWDRVLSGLDAYCAALSLVASGQHPAGLVAACETFGTKLQSLATAAKANPGPHPAATTTALTEIGSILLRLKADAELAQVARDADPAFQSIVRGLIDALGFTGEPPAPARHGILATYEADFQVHNAERAKTYAGGAIAGFDRLDAAQKRAKIEGLIAWLGDQQRHDDFVAAITALAAALHQAALAHQALAHGSGESAAAALAHLRAEAANVRQIYQHLTQG